jgi:hypothetical protein
LLDADTDLITQLDCQGILPRGELGLRTDGDPHLPHDDSIAGRDGTADQMPAPLEDVVWDLPPLAPETRTVWDDLSRWLALLALSALLGAVLWWSLAELGLYRTPAEALPVKIFVRLYRMARRLGIPLQPGDTAYRFTARLEGYFALFEGSSLLATGMDTASEAARRLAGAYVRQSFAPEGELRIDPIELIRAYRKLRRQLWILYLLKTLYCLRFLRPALGQDVRQFVLALQAGK